MLLGLVENGMYITQCYGMTETCGDGLVNYAQTEPHIRALGKPDGHCEYKLDETGEICIRGATIKTPKPPPRSSTKTAGSTPATWPVRTRTAITIWWAGRRT